MRRPASFFSFFFYSVLGVCMIGCTLVQHQQTVSDGEIVASGDFDVHGTIDCEPNEGPMGTPVTVIIVLDRGASLVCEIQALQATEESCWEFVRTPQIDPVQYDAVTWSIGHGVYLSGKNGIVRFSVCNTDTEIGSGDIDINSGKPAA
ncbi:MAG: hypothetical protein JXQ30_04110 [Spirochaetes bacterium]|nr:hypothetical protein [Spirochaetota bacterium]